MIEFVNSIFTKFAWETGILGSIKQYQDYWFIILILLGILTCFLGFKTYRAFFSLFTFMGIVIVCSHLMRNITDWGTIVTTFSVLGITLAFLSYNWKHLGAIVISILITLGFISMIYLNIVVTIILCVLVSIFTLNFPVISISILTSIFGGIMISEVFGLQNFTMMFLIVYGILIQIATNRDQSVFEKEYPDKVKRFIEKRKKGVDNHVRSIEKRN